MSRLLSLILCCLLFGCAKPEPPKQLPDHFEGSLGDAYDATFLTIDLQQEAGQLKGHYDISRPGKPVEGDFTGTTAGNEVKLTLLVPETSQKRLGWSDKLELTLNLGEATQVEIARQYEAIGEKVPPEIRALGSIPQLGGWALFSENGQAKKKLVVLYNLDFMKLHQSRR
ncbi:MAG: hypothetical protein AB7S38_16570 [Vulcanimicrobiota bacterium]